MEILEEYLSEAKMTNFALLSVSEFLTIRRIVFLEEVQN